MKDTSASTRMSFKHLSGYYTQGRCKKVKMSANKERRAQMSRDGREQAETGMDVRLFVLTK